MFFTLVTDNYLFLLIWVGQTIRLRLKVYTYAEVELILAVGLWEHLDEMPPI
jgi:hypothetical protein